MDSLTILGSLLAIYMTTKQVMHFLQNDDATTINYRRLNLSPKDKYPAFSLCFTGSELYWYHAKPIFRIFGLQPSKFGQMLKGQKVIRYDYNYSSMLYNKIPVDLEHSADLDIEQFSIKLSDILTGFEFAIDDDISTIRLDRERQEKEIDNIPFYVGLRATDTICFTRASRDLLGTLRIQDWLALNTSVLESPLFQDVLLQIFVHYPQQLVRSFHKPAFQSKLKNLEQKKRTGLGTRSYYSDVKISVSKIKILRKRPGSNVPCDEYLENDDEKLEQQIRNRIKCNPPYWIQSTSINSSTRICNSGSELEKAHALVRSYKNILKSYHAPCIQMETLTKWEFDRAESKDGEGFRIRLMYEDSDYEEVTNTKSFDFASLVSGVGGFIGIFLGYSLLQIPNLMELLASAMLSVGQHIWGGEIFSIEKVTRAHDN